jgi:hypothetical protein
MKRTLFTILLSGLLLSASLASATIVRSMSLDEMTRTADVVIRATVENRASNWNDERTRIYTITTLRVAHTLKGPVSVGEQIRIRQIGGSVGEITQMVSGNARFTHGEEVLVFLDRDAVQGLHYVIGMAQGKYTVNRRTTPPTVERNVHGMTIMPRPGQAALVPSVSIAPNGAALPELEQKIRTSITRP